MPTSEVPSKTTEPEGKSPSSKGSSLVSLGLEVPPARVAGEEGESAGDGPDAERRSPAVRGSRWVDYETHELLELIGELEDERRWSRLREGIWLALLLHVLLVIAAIFIPKHILHQNPIDPIDAMKNRVYLDLPPDALANIRPKVQIKPVTPKESHVDKKTLEALNKPAPPPTPVPQPVAEPKLAAPAPPQPTQPVPPAPQGQVEMPRPAAVPARPDFSQRTQNPGDALRDAMRNSRNQGPSQAQGPLGGLARHPGAGGGAEILSDTQGVDFNPWLRRWYFETEHTWDPLIPDEVNPPILKSGQVMVRFKILPNGRVMDGSMRLEGSSGDVALDRAAWGAITGSSYPPLPSEFHGPFLELRALFMYNMQPK